MEKILNRNYILNDNYSRTKYIFTPILIQIAGTVLFIVIASSLLFNGTTYEQAILIAFVISSLIVVFGISLLHLEDMKNLRNKMWPLHSAEDAFRYAQKLLDKAKEINNDYARLLKDVNRGLIENNKLSKSAQSIQATHLLPEINQVQQNLIIARREIIEQRKGAHEDYIFYKASFERLEDNTKDRRKELEQYSSKVSFIEAIKYDLRGKLSLYVEQQEGLSTQINPSS